ncbi:hypothetical protein B484DRAFT_457386 [Ochromonadaceae sp. CCMP2298]|nr:hypothetical protein B484DRAFT_457386 [Ochromonadaceae sp. CCMP2298]
MSPPCLCGRSKSRLLRPWTAGSEGHRGAHQRRPMVLWEVLWEVRVCLEERAGTCLRRAHQRPTREIWGIRDMWGILEVQGCCLGHRGAHQRPMWVCCTCPAAPARPSSCKDVLPAALGNGSLSLPAHSLLIVDEAHNLRQEELVAFAQRFLNVLLLTATPPRQMSEVIPHRVVYHYPMAQAIEEKYVCDYRVYLPMQFMQRASGAKMKRDKQADAVPLLASRGDADYVDAEHVDADTDDDSDSGGEEEGGGAEDALPVELFGKGRPDLLKKALFLANGMLRKGSRRCIAYFASQQECTDFNVAFRAVMDEFHYRPCWTGRLVDTTTPSQRESVLADFVSDRVQQEPGVLVSDPSALRVLASVRILDEGVDLPACDSVFLACVGDSTSDIRTVQRLCRANRLDPQRPHKVASCFMWAEDTASALDCLRLLRENDPLFSSKVRALHPDYDGNARRVREAAAGVGLGEEQQASDNFRTWLEHDVRCMTLDEIWEYKYGIFVACVLGKKLPRLPFDREIFNELKIGKWYHRQVRQRG